MESKCGTSNDERRRHNCDSNNCDWTYGTIWKDNYSWKYQTIECAGANYTRETQPFQAGNAVAPFYQLIDLDGEMHSIDDIPTHRVENSNALTVSSARTFSLIYNSLRQTLSSDQLQRQEWSSPICELDENDFEDIQSPGSPSPLP
jgi:hypothetical protein